MKKYYFEIWLFVSVLVALDVQFAGALWILTTIGICVNHLFNEGR